MAGLRPDPLGDLAALLQTDSLDGLNGRGRRGGERRKGRGKGRWKRKGRRRRKGEDPQCLKVR